jgi:peptide/nickel transport system permease protein
VAVVSGWLDTAAPPAEAAEGESRWAWVKPLLSPKIVTGFVIMAVFILAAVFGPVLWTKNPSTLSNATLQSPTAAHPLGTTATGQDVLAQLLAGARVSLEVGFASAAIATVIGMIVGIVGGYLAGVTDEVLSFVSNIFLVIPTLPLVIVISGYLPSKGDLSVTLVIALTGWAWGARIQRAQTLSIRKRDYISAARATGEGLWRIVIYEILPNEMAIVVTGFLGTVIFAILTQAGLAFLGLSSVSEWSWGTMLYWAQSGEALQVGAWWWFVPPGLCIALVGTALALINFGIDEFINPRLRTGGAAASPSAKRQGLSRFRPRAAAVENGPVAPTAFQAGAVGEDDDFTAVDGVMAQPANGAEEGLPADRHERRA